MKSSLTQAITDMKTGLDESMTKLGAKLDARSQPKPQRLRRSRRPSRGRNRAEQRLPRYRDLRLRSQSCSSSTRFTRSAAGIASISRAKS